MRRPQLDGAGWWQRLFSITVPMLAPEIFVVVLTTLIAALKVFAPIFVLTAGGPDNATLVPSYLTYYHFFTTQRVGYAAAIAVVQMVLTVVPRGDLPALPGAPASDGVERWPTQHSASTVRRPSAAVIVHRKRRGPMRWVVLCHPRDPAAWNAVPVLPGADQRRQDRASTTPQTDRCRFPPPSISARCRNSGICPTSPASSSTAP